MAFDDPLIPFVSKWTAAKVKEFADAIKARIPHSLDTESNGVLVGTGAGAFVFKTLTQFKTILSLTKTDVGLGNVDNVAQLPVSYLDTDATFAANSDTKVPSQKAVKTAVGIIKPIPNQRIFASKLYDLNGVSKTISTANSGDKQVSPANGDYFIFNNVYGGVSDTILDLSYVKYTTSGIFDLYINGVLDSSGYDGYAASAGTYTITIALSERIVPNIYNEIKIVLNGKNASSTNYIFNVLHLRLR